MKKLITLSLVGLLVLGSLVVSSNTVEAAKLYDPGTGGR